MVSLVCGDLWQSYVGESFEFWDWPFCGISWLAMQKLRSCLAIMCEFALPDHVPPRIDVNVSDCINFCMRQRTFVGGKGRWTAEPKIVPARNQGAAHCTSYTRASDHTSSITTAQHSSWITDDPPGASGQTRKGKEKPRLVIQFHGNLHQITLAAIMLVQICRCLHWNGQLKAIAMLLCSYQKFSNNSTIGLCISCLATLKQKRWISAQSGLLVIQQNIPILIL